VSAGVSRAALADKETDMSANVYKPGQSAPGSGQYEQVGPRGGSTGHEITSIAGRPLPPTSKPGQGYVFVDPSKNGSGKK
jgi:hypothetical protein